MRTRLKCLPFIFGVVCLILALCGVDKALLVGVVGLTLMYAGWIIIVKRIDI